MTKTPSVCPCKDCTDRYVGCHSNCSKYKDWKSECVAQNIEINKEKMVNGYLKQKCRIRLNRKALQNQQKQTLKRK